MSERVTHKAKYAAPYDHLTVCGARTMRRLVRRQWRAVTCKRCLRTKPPSRTTESSNE